MHNPANASPATKRVAFLLLVFGAILIGMSPIYVRLSELGPVATAFYRVGVSVPIFFALEAWRFNKELFTKGGRISARDRAVRERGMKSYRPVTTYDALTGKDHFLLFILGFFFALDLIAWHWALEYIYAGNATLLANMSVIFVIPLGWLFFGKELKAIFFVYALVAFAGVIMLSWGQLRDFNSLVGIAWGITAAVFYALYILLSSHLRAKINTIQQMAWVGLFSTIWVAPFAVWYQETLIVTTLFGLLMVLGIGITSQVIGQGVIAYGLAFIAPSVASLVLLVQPIVAAALGWVIFNEVLGPIQILGALVIMIVVYLAGSTIKPAPRPPTAAPQPKTQ